MEVIFSLIHTKRKVEIMSRPVQVGDLVKITNENSVDETYRIENMRVGDIKEKKGIHF